MKNLKRKFTFSFVNKYRFKLIIYISLFWTLLDLVISLTRSEPGYYSLKSAIGLRAILVFLMSALINILLVFRLKKLFRTLSLWLSFLIRSAILLTTAYIVNFIIQSKHPCTYGCFLVQISTTPAFQTSQSY